MKFAKIVFWAAGIWGMFVLTPLFFVFDRIGAEDPPPITHPLFYYGFAGVAFAWQFVFLVIGSNPVRFRPLMLAGIIEKLAFVIPTMVLYLQHRIRVSEFIIAGPDALLAILFLSAFLKTPAKFPDP